MNNILNEHAKTILNRDIIRLRDAYCKSACHKNKMCEYCSIPLSMNILSTLIDQANEEVRTNGNV